MSISEDADVRLDARQHARVNRELPETHAGPTESKDRIFHMDRSVIWWLWDRWQSAEAALRPETPRGRQGR